jgi:single-strand DNA-binding protein
MSFSLNKISLIGNLGQDAETRFTQSNKAVTSFSVATTHSYKGQDGNWISETTWHSVVSWELPDFLKNSLKKGAKFYVEGRLVKRDYTDKEGVKKYITEVVSEKLIPLDPKEKGNNESYTPAAENNNQGATIDIEDDNDPLPF